MKRVVAVCVLAFMLAGCGQKVESAKFVGGSFRYMYHDDAALSNQSVAALSVPEFEGKKHLEAVQAFNAKYHDSNITRQVGAYVADTMEQRYKLKRFKPDLEASRTEYVNGRMEKETQATYWLIVNTPVWRIMPGPIWNREARMQYVIQYRLVDVKTQQLLVGDSCIFNSERYEAAEYAKNNFAQMHKDLASAVNYCKTELSENIDPNKVGRMMTRAMY